MEKINWEIEYDNLLEKDYDERMEVFAAHGVGEETKKEYSGSAYYFCNKFEEVKDIEEI